MKYPLRYPAAWIPATSASVISESDRIRTLASTASFTEAKSEGLRGRAVGSSRIVSTTRALPSVEAASIRRGRMPCLIPGGGGGGRAVALWPCRLGSLGSFGGLVGWVPWFVSGLLQPCTHCINTVCILEYT